MKTILVVDDEKNIRFLYEEEFKDEGYHVLTASNGREALDVLQNQSVDLVLLDIKMPEMDGTEFLGAIRAIEQYRTLPIILSTAYGDYVLGDFTTWLSNGYVLKGADLHELKAKVKEFLGE